MGLLPPGHQTTTLRCAHGARCLGVAHPRVVVGLHLSKINMVSFIHRIHMRPEFTQPTYEVRTPLHPQGQPRKPSWGASCIWPAALGAVPAFCSAAVPQQTLQSTTKATIRGAHKRICTAPKMKIATLHRLWGAH
jgi:hypothetical protein